MDNKSEDTKLELSLTNFQSIGNADLTFEKGINLLLGQSNSGKTAILRAIKVLLTNNSHSARYIKHGEKETEVNMKYLGNDVTWNRTDKDINYTVNGEFYRKAGNSDLFKILEDNGFVLDGKGELMNIEGELQLPFPMDRTSSELFKLFENIFCVSDSSLVLKTYKETEATKKVELKSEEENIVSIERKIKAIDKLKEEVDVEKLEKYKKDLSAKDNEYTLYKKNFDKLNRLTNFIKHVNIDKDKLNTEFNTDKIVEYSNLTKNIDKINKSGKLVKKFKNLNIPEEYTLDNINKYKSLQASYDKLNKLKSIVSKEYTLKTFSTDKIDNYLELLNSYKTVKEYAKSIKKLKKKQEVLEEEYRIIQEKLSKYKTCPLCGHTLEEQE